MNTTLTRHLRQAFAAAAVASTMLLVGCSDSPESLLAKAKAGAIKTNDTITAPAGGRAEARPAAAPSRRHDAGTAPRGRARG